MHYDASDDCMLCNITNDEHRLVFILAANEWTFRVDRFDVMYVDILVASLHVLYASLASSMKPEVSVSLIDVV